jgi:hypothetical protein
MLMSVDSLLLQFGGMLSALGAGLLADRAGMGAAWCAAAVLLAAVPLIGRRSHPAGRERPESPSRRRDLV